MRFQTWKRTFSIFILVVLVVDPAEQGGVQEEESCRADEVVCGDQPSGCWSTFTVATVLNPLLLIFKEPVIGTSSMKIGCPVML